jgi:excisionase family DNA binding protein
MVAIPLARFGLLTVEEAAERRGVSPRTVQRWIEDGGLNHVPVGEGRNRKFLVVAEELDAFQPAPVGAPEGNQNAKKKRSKVARKEQK